MEDRLERLRQIKRDAEGIYGNIEWNLGGLVASAALISTPQLLFLQAVPPQVEVEGLVFDGFQVMGLTLSRAERGPRANELIAAAKRALICEAFEVGAELLVRAVRILHSGRDPYEIDEYFSISFQELWSAQQGKAGSLLEEHERDFFRDCVASLRNWIRHNNGRIPPRKQLFYSGSPRGQQICIRMKWDQDADNNINLLLKLTKDIFDAIREIILDGLRKAVQCAEHEQQNLQ